MGGYTVPDIARAKLAHLMNIQVQDEYSVHSLSVQQHLCCHCQIIQDTEARAEGWEGMVCASRRVAS